MFDRRDETWSYEAFNVFIAASAFARPGINLMDAAEAVPNEADRIDLIAYHRLPTLQAADWGVSIDKMRANPLRRRSSF